MMPRLLDAGITFLRVGGVAVALLMPSVGIAAEAFEIHYAPVENLEHVDVDLLAEAGDTVDLAAFILTDRPIIEALIDAKERGVTLRILLDPSQRSDFERLRPLTDDIRMKRRGPLMHLKSYAVDGRLLRSGSANLTASGLKQQDNDLVVTRAPRLVEGFRASFDRMWEKAVPISEAKPAPALE